MPKKDPGAPVGGRELLLALNAAEGRLQFLLAKGEETLCTQDWAAPSRGTEILAPALERSFALLRLSFAELGYIACVRGPGSFTGIRLVAATAAALARVSGALLAGFDYMELSAQSALAWMSPGRGRREFRIHVLTHARRDSMHAQVFAAEQEERLARPVSGLELLSPQSCIKRVLKDLSQGLDIAAVGSGWARHEALGKQLDAEVDALPGRLLRLPARLPAPEDMLLPALRAEYCDKDIEPLYVRPCDAVENLADIAVRRGDDPASAEACLAALLKTSPGEPRPEQREE